MCKSWSKNEPCFFEPQALNAANLFFLVPYCNFLGTLQLLRFLLQFLAFPKNAFYLCLCALCVDPKFTVCSPSSQSAPCIRLLLEKRCRGKNFFCKEMALKPKSLNNLECDSCSFGVPFRMKSYVLRGRNVLLVLSGLPWVGDVPACPVGQTGPKICIPTLLLTRLVVPLLTIFPRPKKELISAFVNWP